MYIYQLHRNTLPTTYNILSNIPVPRLTPYVVEIIWDHQCGFRRKRSTADQRLSIRQILEKNGSILGLCISYL
jgi:hypothetical protein